LGQPVKPICFAKGSVCNCYVQTALVFTASPQEVNTVGPSQTHTVEYQYIS